MTIEKSTEEISKIYEEYYSILRISLDDKRMLIAERIISAYSKPRIAIAPYAKSIDRFGCYKGAFVEHSLETYKIMSHLDVNNTSNGLVALLGSLGVLGTPNDPLFLDQDSNWHIGKGILYTYNQELSYMTIPHRTLFLLQGFGLKLNHEEYLAILLRDGIEKDSYYNVNKPELASNYSYAFEVASKRIALRRSSDHISADYDRS